MFIQEIKRLLKRKIFNASDAQIRLCLMLRQPLKHGRSVYAMCRKKKKFQIVNHYRKNKKLFINNDHKLILGRFMILSKMSNQIDCEEKEGLFTKVIQSKSMNFLNAQRHEINSNGVRHSQIRKKHIENGQNNIVAKIDDNSLSNELFLHHFDVINNKLARLDYVAQLLQQRPFAEYNTHSQTMMKDTLDKFLEWSKFKIQ